MLLANQVIFSAKYAGANCLGVKLNALLAASKHVLVRDGSAGSGPMSKVLFIV